MYGKFSESPFRLFEEWLAHKIVYDNIPSVAFAIVTSEEIIYSKGFGYADHDKHIATTDKTRYRILSITKPFTATAIMMLVEQGLLNLDDPVSHYLSWFDIDTYDTVVTIRHLLKHTSGLPRDAPFPSWTLYEFPTLVQLQTKFDAINLVAEPGTIEKYSNLGYILLGQVIEAVTSTTYSDFVQTNIFTALKMTNSDVDTPDPKSVAPCYSRKNGQGKRKITPHLDTKAATPAFGLTSTAEDLALFIQHQLQAYHVPSADLLLSSAGIHDMHQVEDESADQAHGLGFSIINMNSLKFVTHSGVMNGFSGGIAFVPQLDIGFVVLMNSAFAPFGPVIQKPFSWLMQESAIDLAAIKDITPLLHYTGRFTNDYIDVVIIAYYGELTLFELNLPGVDPTETKAVLEPTEQEHVFLRHGNETDDKRLEFVRFILSEDSGEVVGWEDPTGSIYRKIETWL